MNTNTVKKNDIDHVNFTIDKINALVTEDIKQEIIPLFSRPNAFVVIDLTGIKYIDSSGFGTLLTIMREAKNNYGTLKLFVPDEKLLSMFKALFLHTIFDIYTDLEKCFDTPK